MIRNYFKKVVTITWFRKVNKIALVGMFVAGGVLVGFKAAEPSQATVKHKPVYTGGVLTGWINIEGEVIIVDYNCDSDQTRICTAQFLKGVVPTPAMAPISAEPGNYF